MPRREYRLSVTCAEPGCTKGTAYRYDYKDDYREGYKRHVGKWKCYRHSAPDEVLAPGNETRTQVLVASRVPSKVYDREAGGMVDGYLSGLFWHTEGAERAGSGSVSGPGFRALASDWPEGTRLLITAEILPPETETGDA